MHYAHPNAVWYDLPRLYRGKREEMQALNGKHHFGEDGEIVIEHLLRSK